jgi:hypothetical protein
MVVETIRHLRGLPAALGTDGPGDECKDTENLHEDAAAFCTIAGPSKRSSATPSRFGTGGSSLASLAVGVPCNWCPNPVASASMRRAVWSWSSRRRAMLLPTSPDAANGRLVGKTVPKRESGPRLGAEQMGAR